MTKKITLIDICKALANGEFIFFYQPIISLVSGKISGAEALIRWRRSDGSIISPAEFIPLSIEKGFITEITREMFPKLLADLVEIESIDNSHKVSFNVTAQDLEQDDFAEFIGENITRKRINPKRLEMEITENVLMPPNPIIKNSIFNLANLSTPLVLNDFSAGNTSVQFLSQLPLSLLKLSMNVVKRSPLSKMDFRILRHLVSMAHQLHLDVVAEGVETKEIYDLILSTGSTLAQGYYFSRPLPLMEYMELIGRQPRWVKYPFGLEYLAQIDHIDMRRDVIREALIIYTNQDEEVRQRAVGRLPYIEHTDCLLGEWYYDSGQEWSDVPGFAELGIIHQEFHETAKRLLVAASGDKSWAEMEELIEELNEQSSEIIRYLQRIAKTGLIEHYKSE